MDSPDSMRSKSFFSSNPQILRLSAKNIGHRLQALETLWVAEYPKSRGSFETDFEHHYGPHLPFSLHTWKDYWSLILQNFHVP
jgi:hypothetical protein